MNLPLYSTEAAGLAVKARGGTTLARTELVFTLARMFAANPRVTGLKIRYEHVGVNNYEDREKDFDIHLPYLEVTLSEPPFAEAVLAELPVSGELISPLAELPISGDLSTPVDPPSIKTSEQTINEIYTGTFTNTKNANTPMATRTATKTQTFTLTADEIADALVELLNGDGADPEVDRSDIAVWDGDNVSFSVGGDLWHDGKAFHPSACYFIPKTITVTTDE